MLQNRVLSVKATEKRMQGDDNLLLNCETAVNAGRNLLVMSNFIVNHTAFVSVYTECTKG